MEQSLYSWTVGGGRLFDEDGPKGRDRRHRAALREVRKEVRAASRRERTGSTLQGWITRVIPGRSTRSIPLACCTSA